jgi:hypothetical protein
MPMYRGIVVWQGAPRIVFVMAADAKPLIGTRLLASNRATIEFKPGGQVAISPLQMNEDCDANPPAPVKMSPLLFKVFRSLVNFSAITLIVSGVFIMLMIFKGGVFAFIWGIASVFLGAVLALTSIVVFAGAERSPSGKGPIP